MSNKHDSWQLAKADNIQKNPSPNPQPKNAREQAALTLIMMANFASLLAIAAKISFEKVERWRISLRVLYILLLTASAVVQVLMLGGWLSFEVSFISFVPQAVLVGVVTAVVLGAVDLFRWWILRQVTKLPGLRDLAEILKSFAKEVRAGGENFADLLSQGLSMFREVLVQYGFPVPDQAKLMWFWNEQFDTYLLANGDDGFSEMLLAHYDAKRIRDQIDFFASRDIKVLKPKAGVREGAGRGIFLLSKISPVFGPIGPALTAMFDMLRKVMTEDISTATIHRMLVSYAETRESLRQLREEIVKHRSRQVATVGAALNIDVIQAVLMAEQAHEPKSVSEIFAAYGIEIPAGLREKCEAEDEVLLREIRTKTEQVMRKQQTTFLAIMKDHAEAAQESFEESVAKAA